MAEAWQNTDGQQMNRGYNGGNPSFGSRNFNNSNFTRGPRRDNNTMNGGGYQGKKKLIFTTIFRTISFRCGFHSISFDFIRIYLEWNDFKHENAYLIHKLFGEKKQRWTKGKNATTKAAYAHIAQTS